MFYVMHYNDENDNITLLKLTQKNKALEVFNELKNEGLPVAYTASSSNLRNYRPDIVTHRVNKFKKIIRGEVDDSLPE